MATQISKADIQKYREIANTISDVDTLTPYIEEAENVELRELLGDALYYDYVNSITDTKYAELLAGKDYTYSSQTIHYDGIKPFLCYIAYARLLTQQGISVTRFGVVRKKTEESEPAEDTAIARMISRARSTAQFYQNQIVQFLDTEKLTYTLWGESTSNKRTGSIKITQITNT